jgi:HD-GYP domain-containing protein (c-di-GMP phosphodiesterase class II)
VRLARALARALDLGESEVGVISFAASVHDAGMTRIGERLTASAGAPDEAGREALRHPAEAGAQRLGPVDTVSVARDVVLTHHEWWDGSGYPRGLAGEEIPVGGRILAVVDAWESMTVGRAHKAARSREEALAELRRLRGSQFDPRVVDVFESVLDGMEQGTDAAAA